ncbi:MAG: hypothetical protein ACJ72D_11470 [Marmoricola sp.]
MKIRSLLSAAVIALLVPTLVACGGSKDKDADAKPTKSSSSSPSKSADPTSGLVPLTADGFSMKLPHEAKSSPQTFDTPAGKVNTTVYSDVNDDGGFVVAMSAYPNGAKVDLDGAVKGVAGNFSGTVAVNRTIEVNGYPARQVRIDNATTSGTAITIYLLAVDVNDKLFQLQYIIKGEAPETAPAVLDTVASTITFS